MKLSDFKIIKNLRFSTSKTSKTHYNKKDIKIMNKAGEHFILDFINPWRRSFVVIFQNKIIGYITINLSKERLRHIFVSPEYFHKGIGKYLMYQTEKIFKEHKLKNINLYARLNAVEFYKKLEFLDIEEYIWCNVFTKFSKIKMRYMVKKINTKTKKIR